MKRGKENYEKISKSNNEREKRRDTKTKIIFLSWDRERSTEKKHQLNGAWCGDSVRRCGGLCVCWCKIIRENAWVDERVVWIKFTAWILFFLHDEIKGEWESYEFPFVYHDRNWLLLCYFKESAKMYIFASFLFSRDITENIFLSLDFCFDDISWAIFFS